MNLFNYLLFFVITAACGFDSEFNNKRTKSQSNSEITIEDQGLQIVGGHTGGENIRPEVGFFTRNGKGNCTGTLITKQIVITAAHCLSVDKSGAIPVSELDSFQIYSGSKQKWIKFRVNGVHSLTTVGKTGRDDIALLHLTRAVPPDLASPVKIAVSEPATGTPFTKFGFGCNNRLTRNGPSVSQYIEGQTGTKMTANCWGDSGGPVFIGKPHEMGEVWLITSAISSLDKNNQLQKVNSGKIFYGVNNVDVSANAVFHRAGIMSQVEIWERTIWPELPWEEEGECNITAEAVKNDTVYFTKTNPGYCSPFSNKNSCLNSGYGNCEWKVYDFLKNSKKISGEKSKETSEKTNPEKGTICASNGKNDNKFKSGSAEQWCNGFSQPQCLGNTQYCMWK